VWGVGEELVVGCCICLMLAPQTRQKFAPLGFWTEH
jgi:hypothetical protein